MIPPVSIQTALAALTDHWSPKVIARVNDQYVKIAKLKGEFVWHRHEEEDELFQVIHGRLRLQFEDGRETLLSAGELCVVPRGVTHRPIADEECAVLLIETVTTKHTGDVETPMTRSIAEQLA
jgi:quercetin dioxygenase-like cupin family protein